MPSGEGFERVKRSEAWRSRAKRAARSRNRRCGVRSHGDRARRRRAAACRERVERLAARLEVCSGAPHSIRAVESGMTFGARRDKALGHSSSGAEVS